MARVSGYDGSMKRIIAIIVTVGLSGPVMAQEDGAGDLSEGLDLLSEGTRLLMEGLMQELAPALEGLREGLDDLSVYHPPEMLPNGDIIIRRKTPLEVEDPEGGVEL